MKFFFPLVGLAALAAVAIDARCSVEAADLDHVHTPLGREVVVRRHQRVVVVPEEVVVPTPVPVPVPVPAYPPPPFDGPYGAFTYFPTHYPNYGYGY